MNNNKTLRKYVITAHSIIACMVVLIYTALVNIYFVNGLDEGNFQDLHLEAKSFTQAYNNNKQPEIPNSIHFKGFINWQSVPAQIKKYFPELEFASQLQMHSKRLNLEGLPMSWPEQVIFVLAQPLNDGNIFYLTRQIDIETYQALSKNNIKNMFKLTWPLALLFLIIMHLYVHFILKRTMRPLHHLGTWIDNLTLNNVTDPIPDFEFNELKKIAFQQQKAMLRISDVLDKEQAFLRHASHELRTPIAVVKSNAQLMERREDNPKNQTSIERIKRAALNMQHMTETLLWLSREDENEKLIISDINISDMIKHLLEDNQYLLQGKTVELNFEIDELTLKLAPTPCRLILNNIIRNAFQYTAQGNINIYFESKILIIENINTGKTEFESENSDYGYGLGLQLVDKIIRKMNWQYENKQILGGRKVTIDFR
ncbi:HAMP domain-containing histidine kinase [Pseudoalteromonas sp. C2R02]|uniref:sensor histidine kinase n=1 Tax=Pseudoalteromonas sp. C2R02 TaxID=2841565 RepID=UPI001C09CD3A|nr:HAMP domain-containing sensor histidine kinase [Pseudoalteromonas sp. C2R02]MBU2968686.1 HAMP domain-containing histidine kinase [Pseudoalteromonas sp. C2R02]